MKNNNIKKSITDFIKENHIASFFLISNLLNAIILRLFTTGHFGLRAMFFDLSFVLILTAISFLLKKRQILYYYIATLLMISICVINSIYHNYYASFVSVSLLATSVFVKDVGDVVIDFALKATDWLYFWALIGLYIIVKRNNKKVIFSKQNCLKILKITFISLAIGCSLPPYNAWSRLFKLWNRVYVVDSWGPYIYQIDDIFQSVRPKFNNLFGYDNALKITKEYYENNKQNRTKNEYTNIFEGKNVIVIHAESLQTFTLDMEFEGKKVAPNLSKLAQESLYFSNFYAQIGVGTSSDTEFTFATSLLPSNNGTVFVNYYNNKYITIQNLLKNKGYYVFSMHGNVGDFWNREAMHTNMGYDKFYSKSSFTIDEEYGLGLSDKSFFHQVVPMIKEIDETVNTPYYGTLITLTNHTPWRDANLYSDYKVTKTININGETITRDYLENKAIGNYLKSVNYMDKVIGKFINDMDREGLLENTVIVIYGDHDSRLSKSQYEYMYNYNPVTNTVYNETDEGYIEFNDYDYELIRKVPLIIWTKDKKLKKEINTPMGMIDVLPTLGNMLGVYSNYSLGKDIMNTPKEEAIVVFKDASYLTSSIYYSAKNGEVYTIENSIISEDYINKNSDYASKINEISDNIITYNLIDKLEQKSLETK